jgi:hypothetical protein
MPDPGVVRDNRNRNRTRQASGGLSGFNPNVGTRPKISTNTPANKIQSNQFTAGHQMSPSQTNTISTADRNMMNQSRRPTKTGLGTLPNTLASADRAMMNSAAAGAAGGLGAVDWAEVQKRIDAAASADKKFMPQLPSSTGSTASSYDLSAPNNQGLFGYDPTPAAPKVNAADRKFMPGIDGAPSSYDLTAPNNQGLFGYQAPVASVGADVTSSFYSPGGKKYGIDSPLPTMEEYAEAQAEAQANKAAYEQTFDPAILEEALTVQPAPVMPPMGGIPDMGGDYGGVPVGGNTGNLGITTPDEGEFLQFGSELAGLENQEGMVDESRGFWDISQDRKWDEVMRQIPGLFNQRGMADSGLLNRANALALGDREFETAVRDWMDENQRSAINRAQMAAEQGLMQSQLQNMFDMFGSGAITPMNQPTMNQMDPMGVFNQTADAIAQGPSNYYGTNPTMDQLNAFNAGTAGMSTDQKDALSRLFASKAGVI